MDYEFYVLFDNPFIFKQYSDQPFVLLILILVPAIQ